MTSAQWQRLGIRVTAERIRRGYRTLTVFAAATGLSSSTLDSIEHARKQSYDPATLSILEHALGWKHGSIERVLAGLEPQYDDDPDLTAVIDAWPNLSPGSRRMLRRLAIEAARAERE